jgi:hypothetical protein
MLTGKKQKAAKKLSVFFAAFPLRTLRLKKLL